MAVFAFSQNNSPTNIDTANYPYWIEMMQDPSVNFFKVQSAFNKYWEHRPITKSCGWKPFKRWEYMMQSRVSATGERQASDKVLKEYQKYMSNSDNIKSINGNWTSLGPTQIPSGKGYKGLGRINAIAFDPVDQQTIYIGAPSGGLWASHDGGSSWTVLTDQLPTLGVSSIVVDYTNTQVIYMGTGDRDAGDASGLGVWKSFDGGVNWLPYNVGMENTTIGKMIIDPANPNILYAAGSNGVFKTTDGGLTWTVKSTGNFKDIVFKPNDSTIIYASSSGKFYRSQDSGETWTCIHNGIPAGSRGAVAVTPANPEIVYVILTQSDNGFKGFYKSTDSGLNFTVQSTTPNIMDWSCDGSGSGGQGWYDLDIAVDPQDENLVFAGGVDIWKSYDGGVNWQITAHWYGGCGVTSVHADHHVFEYSPLNGRLYIGCDGGAYYTANEGQNWTEISDGLVISQAYKIGQSATKVDLCVNGYQDNGSSLYDSGTWYAINGGDGMECAIDPTDSRYRYSTLYYGSIYRHINMGSGQYITDTINGVHETGGWVTPFLIDKGNSNTMFIGYKNVYRSNNVKATNPSSVHFDLISDGLAGADLNILAQSYKNTDILYASSGSKLYRTENCHAETPVWINMTENLPASNTITAIETNPFDENIIYLAQQTKLYRSSDKGQTWVDITGSLPEVNINSIAAYKHSINGIYVGTDVGVYYKDGTFCGWATFTNGMPASAKVTELEIYTDDNNPANDRIKAGTYGRGMWESNMYTSSPMADFSADQTLIPPGCAVNFTDWSSGVPYNWEWTFYGTSTGTSTERNPQAIVYNTPGRFDVQLVVSNDQGRDTLLMKNYITVASNLIPEAGFSASQTSFCAGENATVTFTDTSTYCPNGWTWTFDPNTVTFVNGTTENSQNPQVQFNETGNYNVTLMVFNANGSNTISRERYINIGGYPVSFTENFDNGLQSKGWIIENPDNNITWALYANANTYQGDLSVFMNFYNYHTPPGKRDRLISPAIDLIGENNVHLNFRHAYAKQYTSISDSLIVYISNDCGNTWTRIFADGDDNSGNFATYPLTTDEFMPVSYDDWCDGSYGSACNSIDISQWAGSNNVKIAFESYNHFGNNLFVDDISITNGVNIPEINYNAKNIRLFPNPTKGSFTILTDNSITFNSISILNLQGQEVFHANVSENKVEISLGNCPKGLYFVKINSQDASYYKKIVIE